MTLSSQRPGPVDLDRARPRVVIAFRALIDFVRSWAIMGAGARLALQWKMSFVPASASLAAQLFRASACRRHRLAFSSIDRIQQTLSTASISPVVDGMMAFVLLVMMWLYDPWLALLAVAITGIYAVNTRSRLPAVPRSE